MWGRFAFFFWTPLCSGVVIVCRCWKPSGDFRHQSREQFNYVNATIGATDLATPPELQIYDSVTYTPCRCSRRDEAHNYSRLSPKGAGQVSEADDSRCSQLTETPDGDIFDVTIEKRLVPPKVRPALFVVLYNSTGPLPVQYRSYRCLIHVRQCQ